MSERDGQRLIRLDNNKHNNPDNNTALPDGSVHMQFCTVSFITSELSLDDHYTNFIKVIIDTPNMLT